MPLWGVVNDIVDYIGIYCRWVKIVKVIYYHHITTPHVHTLYGYQRIWVDITYWVRTYIYGQIFIRPYLTCQRSNIY